MRIRSLALAAFAIVAIVPASASAWNAAAARTLKPGDKYVALGSSFASGPAIPDVADASCLRSTNNYPSLVAAKLKLALTDVSCGAATTDHILSAAQGVHPPQIGAVTADTKLVTVTIGGNDVGYTVSNLGCAGDGAAGRSCLGTDVHPEDVDALLAQLPAKMAATFAAIKQAAPQARIVALPYLRVLPDSTTPCPPGVPMLPADLAFMREFSQKLYTVIKQSAMTAKVDFVDSYAPKGHDACAAPDQQWVGGTVPASPGFPFHPNAAGMKAQAKMILQKLRT